MQRILVSGIGLLFLLSMILAQESEPTAEDIPLGIPPTIDGIISPGEWIDANIKSIELEGYDGRTKNAKRYLKYNNRTFYFALVVEGESEEAYVWLGDDESQAFQKGTDIKRFPKSAGYACSDWHYRGLYDMVEDEQQDVNGTGRYTAEADETTVELEIPFDSGDVNDYQIDYSNVFTAIYGSIHKSSPDAEYKDVVTIQFNALRCKSAAVEARKAAKEHEDEARDKEKTGRWGEAASSWEKAASSWNSAKEAEKCAKNFFNEAAETLGEIKRSHSNAGREIEAEIAESLEKDAKEFAQEAEEKEKEAEEKEKEARTKAGEASKKHKEQEVEIVEDNGCLGTVLVAFLVIGVNFVHFKRKK